MKRKSWIFWVFVGAVVLIVLNLPRPVGLGLESVTREALAPLQAAVANLTSRLHAAREGLAARGGMPDQLRELREEKVLLQTRLADAEEVLRENMLLRQQLGFQERLPNRPVPAEVIARDISGWWQTLRVDHGGADAVRADQAVITPEGLVGRVLNSSRRTADVLLISDPGCRVSVQVGTRGVFGVLSGEGLSRRGEPLCRLDLVNHTARINVGDPVFTSGLGGVFPRGILVGHVLELETTDRGLHQRALVAPAANLGDLRVVFLLTDPGEGDL